jgi:hypothetical protein
MYYLLQHYEHLNSAHRVYLCIKYQHTLHTVHNNVRRGVKVKVKVTLEQATKAHRWSTGIALHFL